MKGNAKRALAVLLIIAIAIGIGFAVDAIWTLIERQTHPQSYTEIIARYAEEYNIPKEIVYAVIKAESDFDPEAKSSVGAIGLMQMMPSTFEWLTGDEHLGEHLPVSSLTDPEVNIRYGTYYLLYLYRKFDYNWNTTFAAYNGGEGNVAKWLKSAEYSDGQGNLTNIPYPETASYVKRVNDAIEIYRELYFENTNPNGEVTNEQK